MVALPASPRARSLQATESGLAGTQTRLFAKTGLLVRAGASLTIGIGPGFADRARIGWGVSPIAAELTVTDCQDPARPEGTWLAYAGGYYVDRPMCLPILITTGRRSAQVSIGVGTTCPGQQAVETGDVPDSTARTG
ncbi:hypothetical protein SAMN04515671_0330 [Nakamurella panacisegetis]|uniref:Uncharacterized protein n=1 Tax=Nakamurella panacisegetis TaxID=1090615 RepID=A0A1H0I2Y1_9ACTN|nr:hypothetical protein SAMN04515671_0330 [Nakamurella panacisegetis]